MFEGCCFCRVSLLVKKLPPLTKIVVTDSENSRRQTHTVVVFRNTSPESQEVVLSGGIVAEKRVRSCEIQ
jgi:hypothetical protein